MDGRSRGRSFRVLRSVQDGCKSSFGQRPKIFAARTLFPPAYVTVRQISSSTTSLNEEPRWTVKELRCRPDSLTSRGRSFGRQCRRIAEDRRALYDVIQFADVARPSIASQRVQAAVIDISDLLAMLLVRLLNEVLNQQGQVFDTLSERRKMNRKNLQPKVQILA
jgi:hypothetical protein